MGPKPKKNSPTRSKSPNKANNDASYLTINLNDDDWRAMVAFVLPSSEYDELYIEQLEKSVKKGHRRRFTWFSKKDLMDLIMENTTTGKKVAKKPANITPLPSQFITLIDLAKQHLDNKEEIPDPLMTQLIKAKLLYIKHIEKEREITRNKRLLNKNDPNVKTAGTKKDKSPSGKKSPTKPKKTNAGTQLSDIEKQTQLKRKEDIEEEEKYFDDEPKDGPNHYIILSGFYSATLLNHLDDFQLSIDCIIKFKSPSSQRIFNFMTEIQEREKTETNLKANLRINVEAFEKTTINTDVLNEERQNHLNKTKALLERYWSEVNHLLERVDDKLKLRKHIARLKYNLRRDPQIKSWFEVERRAEFSDLMFDEVAEKLFTLCVQKRQYGFYVGNLKVFSIPSANPTFTFPPSMHSGSALSNNILPSARGEDLNASLLTTVTAQNTTINEIDRFCDTRYYNELLNSFPAEYISTPIILHCMIEQIVATDEKKPLPSESTQDASVPVMNNLSYDVSKYFSEMVSNLALDDREMNNLNHLLPKHRQDNSKKKMSINTPFLVNFNDEVSNRLKGVFEDSSYKRNKKSNFKLPFDPVEIETEMLSKSLWTIFTGLPYVPQKLAKERAARLQELLHFCSTPEITNTDVDRAFKQFVFETMNLTDTNKRSTVRKTDKNIVIPWDDPYPNINTILNEEQQLLLKNLNTADAKKESEEAKKTRNRISSASTTKSIKFSSDPNNSNDPSKDSSLSSILKSRSSTKLSVQSVHFPDAFDLNSNEIIADLTQPKTINQSVEMINNTKKRDLTDWNLAEHYEPKVLVQKLQNVSYTHPYVDTYYNRRDNSLMLVFSNPFEDNSLANNEDWTIKLHSNVGFRNYLEKIYEMIVDWTRDEEAKYQASLIAKEVDKFRSESAEREKEVLANATTSRPTSKSTKEPPPSPDKGKKKGKVEPVSADEGDYITENFIGHNSLKAWKLEQDKNRGDSIGTAKDRNKKPKSPKPKSPDAKKEGKSSKSPTKHAETPKPKVSARGNSPKKGSRSNSKASNEPAPQPSEPAVQKANVPFIGYDVGNNMIYVKSHLNHMFPSNGALIKTEKHLLKTSGKTFISTTVVKDGHTFSLHIVDPKSEEELNKINPIALVLNSSRKSPTKSMHIDQTSIDGITLLDNQSSIRSDEDDHLDKGIAKYSCFTGVFNDGLNVSYSVQYLKRKIKKSNIPDIPPTPRTLISEHQLIEQRPPTSDEKGKKSTGKNSKADKKSDSNPGTSKYSATDAKKNEENVPVVNKMPDIKEEHPTYKVLPWSQLFLSMPTGLTCTFLPETYAGVEPTKNNEPHRLVVKQYYSSRCEERASEHFKNFNPQILKEKSRLIKSDGSVIKFLTNNNIEIYYPNGTIYRRIEEVVLINKPEIEIEPSETSETSKNKKKATKTEEHTPNVHFEQKLSTKWIVITPNGSQFMINKEDKTNELIGYHRCIQARDIQTGEVMISREDNLKIVYRTDGSSLVEFEDGTRITTFYAQNDLNLSANERDSAEFAEQKKEKYIKIECQGFASTIFNSKTTECTLAFGTGTLVACDPKKMIYNVIFNTGELLDINQEGLVSFLSRNSMENSKNKFLFSQISDTILEHEDEEGNKFHVNKLGKCTTTINNQNSSRNKVKFYQKHSPRFFVIHKDSSGTELLRYEDINEYMSEVEVDPMTAIIRDNVQGYPNIMGTTVLRPLKNCLTDVWLCEYDEKDVTPPGLRCRNLSTYPPNPEIKVPGAKFGANIGRGLQIDIDHNRKVKNPPLTIAKRMEFRQLIEYQKLSDEVRASLLNGLKNYMKFIVDRAENHRLLLTYDPRTETEKLTAYKVLQLARPDSLFKADISALYKSALGLYSVENYGKSLKVINKLLINNRSNRNENLKEELNREKTNKEAWKSTFVPAYFQSDWGKAFLENDSSKDSNTFLQTSENIFNQNDQSQQREIYDENCESKSIKKTSLPPISNYQLKDSFLNEKQKEISTVNFERYQPKFKHLDKLNSNKIPSSLKINRINAIPNSTFLTVEDPVRRKIHSSIVQASLMNGKSLERRRGCEVYPSEIKFGILREGVNYAAEFKLVNVGLDACRFKIKQPPLESGLKLVYKSGPIAAGMSRDVSVVLLALYKLETDSVEQIDPKMRSFKYTLEITTETDTIIVPIEAEILTAEEFRNMFRGNLEAGKNTTTRIISVRPGSVRELLTRQMTVQNINSNKNKNNFILNEPFV